MPRLTRGPRAPLTAITTATLTALALAMPGCQGPLERTDEQALRESLLAAHRQHLQAVAAGEVVEVSRPPSEVEQALSPERRAELDAMSGVEAYEAMPLELGPDLLGREQAEIVRLSLQDAIALAVEHNLDVKVARLAPAIAATRIIQAEAVFDATFFTNANWAKLDEPRPGGVIPGLAGDRQSETFELTTGIRKPLTTGGAASVETTILRDEQQPTVLGVNRFYDADVLFSLRQPVLRQFGSDVNTAEIRLATNARAQDVQRLKAELLALAFQVEETYWNLVFARQRLLIQLRLLERTIDDRDRLEQRAEFDVSPVRLTEANSFVELRRAEVIRARQAVRAVSDQLKRLLNAPDLPITDETLILPTAEPVDAPIRFSLLDAVATALRERPELQVALLQIRDATIRQRVADNARLPILDLIATVGFGGLGIDGADDAYDQLGEGDYIDYLLGAEFELPIGNRAAEAQYEERQLQRRQAVLAYRREAQQTVLEVKDALREIMTAYELIGVTRAARRAAADNLRAIQEQEEAGVALTPEFLLDLKLQAQQRLADAEVQEIDALTRYMTSIAELYRVMGTLLERDEILFVDEPVE